MEGEFMEDEKANEEDGSESDDDFGSGSSEEESSGSNVEDSELSGQGTVRSQAKGGTGHKQLPTGTVPGGSDTGESSKRESEDGEASVQ
jgi:hypothetical protein